MRAAGAEVVRAWMPPSSHPGAVGPGGGVGPGLFGGGEADAGGVAGALAAADDGGPSVAWEVGLAEEGTERLVERTEWQEVRTDGGTELHLRVEWEEHSSITSWQEGPFSYPVEVPAPVSESFVGRTRVFRAGPRTRVVYGPWQIVIRGIGATRASQVISRWEVYRSWAAERGGEITGFAERAVSDGGAGGGAGASERLMVGSSERRWVGSSELRLGGSSEIHFVGASERRLMGASELAYAGSSERLRRGGQRTAARRLQ